MTEYYEPNLYMSSPGFPNTMGVCVTLTEPVDGDILREVVEELRERFPYFYVRVEQDGNELIPVPNPLPMTVRNTWEPIDLRSEEANFHLGAFKYEGKRLAFEISHALTDGAGVMPYVKSVMYLYLSRKTGQVFDPAGFRLPGSEIPESEIGNPFAGLDIDGAEPPMLQKEAESDFYRLSDGTESHRCFYLMLEEEQVMRYCKDNDGSPNTVFSVFWAKAVRRADPTSEKTVSICVAVDNKAILGNHDSYRMFVNTAELDFAQDRDLSNIAKACTIARGQLMMQTMPENALWALKQKKMRHQQMAQMPLQMKTDITAQYAGVPRWSIAVSYANSRSFGPLDPYIEELYVVSTPGVTDILCEIACINQHFFLMVAQTFQSQKYMDAFLAELSEAGISYEVKRTEDANLCGVAAV
ncbi:MAG: hypothetical protein Q4A01_01710 [Coriobacteriales bacterium]|nr:hypothetical protein [Coriobacteriales bacterium]